jgi:hypothetical protein
MKVKTMEFKEIGYISNWWGFKVIVFECSECKAIVRSEGKENHALFHAVLNQILNLIKATRTLG